MIRYILALVVIILSCKAQAACTVRDQALSFGNAAYTSPAGSVSVPVVVTVNCPAGQAYTLKPNSPFSTTGNFNIPLVREGVANGNQYLYILNPGGQIMKSAVTGTLITGTGTGADQTYNVTAVLSGATSAGSLLQFNKTGVFSISLQLFSVVGGGTVFSTAQLVSGEVIGMCEIGAVGALSYGTMPSPSISTTYTASTTIQVRCDNTLAFTLLPDNNSSRWTLDSGMGIDVANPLRPSDPAKLRVYIRNSGTSIWANWGVTSNTKPGIGSAAYQSFDIRGDLTLSPNWHGTVGSILNATVIF